MLIINIISYTTKSCFKNDILTFKKKKNEIGVALHLI